MTDGAAFARVLAFQAFVLGKPPGHDCIQFRLLFGAAGLEAKCTR